MRLNPRNIEDLPVGAKYDEKQGRATVSFQKANDSIYIVSSNCDSLIILITEREKEIYHLQNRVRELEDNKEETQTITVKEPNSWQWFLIYSGFILWAFLGVRTIKYFLKWKR